MSVVLMVNETGNCCMPNFHNCCLKGLPHLFFWNASIVIAISIHRKLNTHIHKKKSGGVETRN